MFQVTKKLRHIKSNIKKWKKLNFGNIFESKAKIFKDLDIIEDDIQNEDYNEERLDKEKFILVELHNLIGREEAFWKQISRVVQLKEGDQNTRFFHIKTLKHKANNRITRIKRGVDVLEEEKDIADEAISFFSSLLSIDLDLLEEEQKGTLNLIPNLIQTSHNSMICDI